MRRRALLSGGNIDYSDCFAMVVTVGGNITWTGSTTDNTLSYSKNNGKTWTTANSDTAISVAAGDKVLWKGTPTPQTNKGIGKFSGTTNVRYSVEGNVMSLLFGDDFKEQTSLSGKSYALYRLFYNNTNVTSAENLSLPATTLTSNCYNGMFSGCSHLTTAPVLPATTLETHCYQGMFSNCSSLTTAPKLPAKTLKTYCYCYMFSDCSHLTTAPSLPATTLAGLCYQYMFSGCTSLTTAPQLPAKTLAIQCYYYMFGGCTNLTTAPSLPATTLTSNCYNSMFSNCSSLTTAPKLPAKTLVTYCYVSMFMGCTRLNSIKCLATDVSASNCTNNWVKDVASSGTFTKAASMSSWTTGASGIPSGWTVQDYIEE